MISSPSFAYLSRPSLNHAHLTSPSSSQSRPLLESRQSFIDQRFQSSASLPNTHTYTHTSSSSIPVTWAVGAARAWLQLPSAPWGSDWKPAEVKAKKRRRRRRSRRSIRGRFLASRVLWVAGGESGHHAATAGSVAWSAAPPCRHLSARGFGQIR